MKLAIVGASGVTGGFAFDVAESRGLAPTVIGRDGPGLRAFASRKGLGPERVRIADADDLGALRQAFVGITHVVSAVAPFARHGFLVARAAAELGLGYTDSSGEAGFMLRLIEELDPVARQFGATLCTGNGASAFLGDVATRFTAPIDDPDGEATLIYHVQNYRPTYGTLESYLTSILPAGGPALRHGMVERFPFGAFAGSARGTVGIHGIFPDAIVISRYWGARRLDTLMQGGTAFRPLIKAAIALAIRPEIRDIMFRLPLRRWTAYQPADDLASVVTVHMEAVGADGRRATRSVQARGIYPATGKILVATLQAMALRPHRPIGVRAASEMFTDLTQVVDLTSIQEIYSG